MKDEEVKKRIEESRERAEENMRHNIHIMEMRLSIFMIRMQKKHGISIDEGIEMYYSQGNPFKKEIEKEYEA